MVYFNIKGRNVSRPDDPVLVISLLYCGRSNPRGADTVASHHERFFLSVSVEEQGVQWHGILCAQFEDVSDFDHLLNLQAVLAVATQITFFCNMEVVPFGFEMDSGPDALHVKISLVGARYIGPLSDAEIGQGSHPMPEGTDEASLHAEEGEHLIPLCD